MNSAYRLIELASPARFELATYRFIPLQFSLPDLGDLFGVWTLSSPLGARPVGAARQVSTPSHFRHFQLLGQAGLAGIATTRGAEGSPSLSRFTQLFPDTGAQLTGGLCSIQLSYGDSASSIPSRVSSRKTSLQTSGAVHSGCPADTPEQCGGSQTALKKSAHTLGSGSAADQSWA